ncbi:30S ribosome-binding factor RbfA [Ignavibacteria bacterium]|nr:30S ribosome-binding factor RbfA [Bacteroidota bacterium]MCZ2133089.1 30S ribosome-binding factor RbfA [Bacteroidota bacterium]
MSIRTEKVAGLIKEVLSEPLRKIASELSAGLITVTSVKVSDDLQLAKIYISVLGGKASIADVLERVEADKKKIRSFVARQINLRYAPDLRFYKDEMLDAMDNISSLLNDVRRKDETMRTERDAQRLDSESTSDELH